MFGFSLQKLVVLAAIIAAVWYGFKFVGRLDKARKAALKSARVESAAAPVADVEEMERCAACGTFVPLRGAGACGRDDCPYPG